MKLSMTQFCSHLNIPQNIFFYVPHSMTKVVEIIRVWNNMGVSKSWQFSFLAEQFLTTEQHALMFWCLYVKTLSTEQWSTARYIHENCFPKYVSQIFGTGYPYRPNINNTLFVNKPEMCCSYLILNSISFSIIIHSFIQQPLNTKTKYCGWKTLKV